MVPLATACVYVVGDSVQSGNAGYACPAHAVHVPSGDECNFGIPTRATCNLPPDATALEGAGVYAGAAECYVYRDPYRRGVFALVRGGADFESDNITAEGRVVPNFKAPVCRVRRHVSYEACAPLVLALAILAFLASLVLAHTKGSTKGSGKERGEPK